MSVFCWLPGNDIQYSSYNGNSNLNSSQKNFMVKRIATEFNSDNTIMFQSDGLTAFRSTLKSYVIKMVAKSQDGDVVPVAAMCDVDPTASDEQQADDTSKAIRKFVTDLGLELITPNLNQSVRSAQKMFGIDLFDIGHILTSIPRFDADSLAYYIKDISTDDAIRLRGYLKLMGASGYGTISVISEAAQRSLYQTGFLLDMISNIGAGFAIAKLVVAIIKWINKKKEIMSFDKASNKDKNTKRIAYATEMVGYLNNLQKNQTPLPDHVQKDLINFFSSEENDGKKLYQMTENLSKIAQNKTIMDRLRGAFGIN